MSIYKDILAKKAPIAVIGLGYVGLPIALAFARKVKSTANEVLKIICAFQEIFELILLVINNNKTIIH